MQDPVDDDEFVDDEFVGEFINDEIQEEGAGERNASVALDPKTDQKETDKNGNDNV